MGCLKRLRIPEIVNRTFFEVFFLHGDIFFGQERSSLGLRRTVIVYLSYCTTVDFSLLYSIDFLLGY